jgi:hypothetical protein
MTDAPPHDAIDLLRFAEIVAHLRQFPEAKGDEVLARLGVAKPAWQAASARWSAARDAELAAGATGITRRFGAAFARVRKRLEAEKPALEALGRLADLPAEPPPDRAPRLRAEPLVAPPPPAFAVPPIAVSPPVPRPPSVAPPAYVAPPAMVASTARGAARYGETVAVSGAPPGAALPFAAGSGTASTRPPAPSYDATVALPAGVEGAPPVPAGVPDLTLPQYASLRVDLHRSPDQADAILARYGVPRGGRPPLDAYWRARFDADPLLRMMFAKAYATYTAWLRDRGGGA